MDSGVDTQPLAGRQIVLGVSGGIAAYKSAELCRLLGRAGARVRVLMTPAAEAFITPLTFQALSGNPVHGPLLDPQAEAGMGHIELARWAHQVLIAPASADLLARLAAGMGDDLLTTFCLATEAPIALAPAMNQAMWRDRRTQDNCARLQSLGMALWGPASGDQACGDQGPGRMLEPLELLQRLTGTAAQGPLAGLSVLITAGPTREAIDPVRYLSNQSSGKMGYALAEAAAAAGARVTLVSGPVALACPPGVERLAVTSAEEMCACCLERVAESDIFVAAAAVADYRVAQVAGQKIKKGAEHLQLDLVRNPDILATLASHPQRPFCVGFAAETEQLEAHARAKLKAKKLDLMIANDVSRPGLGFDSDDNAVLLMDARGGLQELGPAPKRALAEELMAAIAERYRAGPAASA